MAFTKVVGPGIHTLSNIASHNINSSGIITATQFDGPFSNVVVGGATTLTVDGINISAGILTAKTLDLNGNGDISGNLVLGGDLTVNGTTTTLDTNLIGVDRIEVLTAGTNVAVAVTHNGTGDLVRLYDGASQKVTVDDEGNVGLGSAIPSAILDVVGQTNLDELNVSGVTTMSGNLTVSNAAPTLFLTDSNGDDFSLVVNGGVFRLRDETNGVNRLTISSSGVLHAMSTVTLGEATFGSSSITKVFSGTGGIKKNALMVLNPSASVAGRGAGVAVGAIGTGDDYIGTLYATRDSNGDNRGTTTLEGKDSIVIKTNAATSTVTAATIDTSGRVLISNTLGLGGATSSPSELLHAQTSSGEGKIVLMGATTGTLAISGLNGASRVLFGDSSTENAGNITYTHSSDTLSFRINGNTRWKFDSSGHFLPDSVGSYNIGSTGAEIGDIFIADDKKVFLGSDQDFTLHHNNAHAIIKNTTGRLYVLSDDLWFKNQGDNSNLARFLNGDTSIFYFAGNEKLRTSPTGATVIGEIETAQDYPLIKPILNWNFAATKTLDPRIQFRRTGTGTFIDEKGIVQYAGSNKPRFDHHPTTGASLGLLLEKSTTNYQPYSVDMSQGSGNNEVTVENNAAISPDGTMNASKITGGTNQSTSQRLGWSTASVPNSSYTNWSIWLKSEETSCLIQIYSNTYTIGAAHITIELADGTTTGSTAPSSAVRYNVEKYPNKWWRVSWSGNGAGAAGGMYVAVVPTTGSARAANTGAAHSKVWYAWGLQEEISTDRKFATSYFPTYGVSAVRGHDNAEVLGDDFDDFFDLYQGTVVHEFSNAFQTWTQGGSGWEFNNDNYQYNVISQLSSGYAHNSYPGGYAVAYGESADSGDNNISLFGSNSSPGNSPTNGGYDAGRYPNSTIVDNTRYYKTYTDAMSWDVSGSTNHLRVSSGGVGATGSNTNVISFRNISKLVFGNEASDMDGSYQKFNGRIKNWMYYDKALPASQLNTMTAQHPQTYL